MDPESPGVKDCPFEVVTCGEALLRRTLSANTAFPPVHSYASSARSSGSADYLKCHITAY